MTEIRLDVYLLGTPQAGVERSALVSNLAAAFKKDVPSIEKMLRKPRTLVKADVDPTLAAKYKALIEQAGGQCELAVHGQPIAASTDGETQPKTLTLEPITSEPYAAGAPEDAAGYCVKCGTLLRAGQLKCPKCFTPISQFSAKDKTAAGFLALFVGGLGIHRFYLGQWWGIFYLIFWGTLIPSIVSIIEAVVFWSTSKERWNEKYGHVEKNSSSMIIFAVVAVFLLITVTGILAAIALPAYQDYTQRAKVAASMPIVENARNKVVDFYQKNHQLPSDNLLANLPDEISSKEIASLKLQDEGQIEVTYNLNNAKQYTIIWTPIEQNGKLSWSCTKGSMPDKIRSPECRGGDGNQKAEITDTNKLSKTLSSTDQSISIKLPSNWASRSDLAETALISAGKGDDAFVIVFAESKADFDQMSLGDYTQAIQEQLGKNVSNMELQGEVRDLAVADLPAQQFTFFGTAENLNLGYVVTIVETDEYFYRVVAWSTKSRFDKYAPLFAHIGESLQTTNINSMK